MTCRAPRTRSKGRSWSRSRTPAAHETRLTDRGPVQVHHQVGFIDAMTSTEVSLATGVGQWAAGRKVGLAAALAGRFPQLLGQGPDRVSWPPSTPARSSPPATASTPPPAPPSTTSWPIGWSGWTRPGSRPSTRKVATRIAADQVTAAAARTARTGSCRSVPGPDGTTDWWARLPAAQSAAAWAAVRDLGDRYATKDPELTLDQARADALLDLLLTNVTVTASVTLGIPVITGPDGQAARDAAIADHHAENPTGSGTTRHRHPSQHLTPAHAHHRHQRPGLGPAGDRHRRPWARWRSSRCPRR